MRARNIKPAFFVNEDLTELPYEARLLFIGLWTLADREGRLADRPKRIKIELFPVDNIDIDSMLNKLANAKFIERYESDGKAVISIGKFSKHQSPHGTEKDSELPDINGYYTVNERKFNGVVTGVKKLINNQSTLDNNEITLNNVKSTLDNALNPECGILNPDLLNPEIKEHVHASEDAPIPKPEKFKDESQSVFDHWTQVMGKNASTKFTPDRKRLIVRNLKEGYTVDQLKTAIDGCYLSDFNMGREQGKPRQYNDIELILRDAKHIEDFTALKNASSTSINGNVARTVSEQDQKILDMINAPIQTGRGRK